MPPDPQLLTPYERLLQIINNKKNDDMEVLEAIKVALPYCKETLAERNAREERLMAMLPKFDGPFSTMGDLTDAQSKVMSLMAAGRLPPMTGKIYIESLALIVKTREVAGGPGNTLLQVVGGLPDLETGDAAPDADAPSVNDAPLAALKKRA
jgi:hypothetical protein